MRRRDIASAAVTAGLGYLARVQDQSGEFPVYSAYSRDMTARRHLDPCFFGTAAIATTLIGVAGAGELRRRAAGFIAQQRMSPHLWGYYRAKHRFVFLPPPDVDDSALASLALVAAGHAAPANRDILLANRDHNGLFFTWIYPPARRLHPALLLEWLRQLPKAHFYRRLFRFSSCRADDVDAGINANVLAWLGAFNDDQKVVDHLMRILREQREATCDKYYDDPGLIRYFFSRALVGRNSEAGELLVARSVVPANASAVDIASAVLVRTIWSAPVSDEHVTRLIAMQRPSGEWPIASFYCAGRPRLDYGTFGPADPDCFRSGSEAMTTALCVAALDAVASAA